MNAYRTNIGWGFWLAWVLASITGSLVAVIAIGAAGNYGESATVLGLLFGIGLGVIPEALLVWLLRQLQSSNIEGMAIAH